MNRVIVFSIASDLAKRIRLLKPQLEIIEIKPDKKELFNLFNDIEIIIADCALIPSIIDRLNNLKWMQSTSAGVERLLPIFDGRRNVNFIVSRFADDIYGLDMAQYIVTQIVNHERQQWNEYEKQKNKIWTQDSMFNYRRLICDMKIGIMGLGNLGKTVAKILKGFHATIWSLTRTGIISDDVAEYIDEHKTIASLPEFLSNCDYIISILPATLQTNGLLDNDVLCNCRDKKPVFVNVGRGNVISEESIVRAIENKWISGAILDVFPIEPLPVTSKLWDLPQVVITPHNACSVRPQAIAELFVNNYEKFTKGESLPNTVDFNRGY